MRPSLEIIEEKIPFVAVWMVTYNHEKFIEQAIKSVMMQQTDFDFKLFIGEDCSTDTTQELCIKLEKKYPKKINLVLNKENLGANKNGIKTYNRVAKSSAKYIAILEGDDYWTDVYKLQKQIDFLEENPKVSICGHSVKVVKKNNEYESWKVKDKTLVSFNDELIKNRFYTLSIVYKNVIEEYPDWIIGIPSGDWAIKLLILEKGDGYLMKDFMGTYRSHNTGIWSSQTNLQAHKSVLKSYRMFLKCFEKHKKSIKLATVKYKLKHNLFFKDFSMYVFSDIFVLFKLGLNKILK